jgi:DNA-binding CsgD family transcriptional regulator
MNLIEMNEANDDSKTKKFIFPKPIPLELRPELEDRTVRENAKRIVYGFYVGIFGHIAALWIGWQRMQQGMFEQQPAYCWIFYIHLVWWLLMWIPFNFIWNWSRIQNGQYPIGPLRLLVGVCIGWAITISLLLAIFNFQFSHALGAFAVVMFNFSLFILPASTRLWVLLICGVVMSVTVYSQLDLTKLQMQYWISSIIGFSLFIFLITTVWYNNMVRQFLDEKVLDTQKVQLTKQAELLAAQNQIIENDKTLLAQQLEDSHQQLNAFALRLAKNGNFLDSVQTDLANINTPQIEDADKKKRLLRKIEQENTRENDWTHFRGQFEQVHPNFFPMLLAEFPTLSTNDLRLMSLLKMNLETQEIADILGISTQSLNTARYRLRKHLGLNAEENLFEFVQRFK